MGAPAGRPSPWQPAEVVGVRSETARAKTFRLRLPAPSEHLAGQHDVVRLTAPDGYTASRSPSPVLPEATAYVCGSAGFADAASRLLVEAAPVERIRVERFGRTA